MSRGSFTALDAYRAHSLMDSIGRLAASIDWDEYLASVEFAPDPPLTDPQVFARLADLLADFRAQWEILQSELARQIALESANIGKVIS